MLQAGDEFCRTQQGNNNAYCQDNEISWVNWAEALEKTPNEAQILMNFVSRVIALRAKHGSLRPGRFLHGNEDVLPGIQDAAWFDEAGNTLDESAWSNAAAQMFSLRRAVRAENDVDLTLAMFNAADEERDFVIPGPDFDWLLVLDSARPAQREKKLTGSKVNVGARSVVLLAVSVAS